MRWLAAKFECPLLARELTQLSTQRRLYFARVLFACALYGGALWFYGTGFGQASLEKAALFGQGRPLFELLIQWQFWGIFLLMPAATAGAITSEKERGTLGLLKLTRLSCWRVLLEKLGSRLLVIGSFLLLPIPLEAVAYGWGGVESDDMIKAAYVLTLTSIQVGSLSLFCSTVCRTTVQAMTLSYLLIAIGYFTVEHVSLAQWLWVSGDRFGNAVFELYGPFLLQTGYSANEVQLRTDLEVYFYLQDGPRTLRLPTLGNASSKEIVLRSLPMLTSILILMSLSRYFLWRRSEFQFNEASFVAMKRWFDEALFRSRDGRILTRRHTAAVPVEAPIAWRECRRRWVGNWEQAAVLLAIFEVPLIYWIACSPGMIGSFETHVAGAWNFLWIGACLTITLISTGLFATERTRQTLDVLLATPLTGSEILLQKMSGVYRLTLLLMVPLATVLLLQTSVLNLVGEDSAEQAFGVHEFMMLDDRTEAQWTMLELRRATAIFLYLPLLAWIGLQYGLRIRNHIGAIVATLITVVAACVLPALTQRLCLSMYPPDTFAAAAWHRLLEWINPWFVACRDEGFGLGAFDGFSMSDVLPEDWFAYLFHFLLVGGMLWGVRRNALRQFGRLIGRLEPQYARYERPAIPLSLQKLPMDRTEFLIVDDEQRASPAGPASGTKNE